MTYKITPSPERGYCAAHGALSRFLGFSIAAKWDGALLVEGTLMEVTDEGIVLLNDHLQPRPVAWHAFDEVVYL